MEFKVLTLRYSPALGVIDDTPLLALARDHEVLSLREHFFVLHDLPHLLCLVSYQPRTTATAQPTQPPAPPPEPARSPPDTTPAHAPPPDLAPAQRALYDSIRRWRFETAQREGVPAYVVLTNREVLALVHEHPTNLTGLGRVRGIGKAKLERHGAALLGLLRGEPPTTGPPLVPVPTPTSDHDQAPVPSPDAITADP